MENNAHYNFRNIMLELVVPVLAQVVFIVVMLFATRHDFGVHLVAIAVSLIWLRATHDPSAQGLIEARARRREFMRIGEWLHQDSPDRDFDEIQEKYGIYPGSIEPGGELFAIVVLRGIANFSRKLGTVLLFVYFAWLWF